MTDSQVYLSVSDLNFYISQKFKNDPYLHKVFLQGELSNFRNRIHSHQYFSLKDEKSKINVVMFRQYFDKLKFKPEEGMKVYVSGYVSTYEKQGAYQFYAETMEPAGLGALYEQLRQLQEKLSKEGLFDINHKKPIPKFPDKIAVVTSASGAVIHDIMVTANRRFPHAEIDLFPSKVQGSDAAGTIVDSLKQIQAAGNKYDVVIIGRGGGSLEDLWPFNEEIVVRQIYDMAIPVISSVGHETDTTLADLVADQRVATPTAAAEVATPNLADVLTQINQLRAHLYAGMQAIITQKRKQVEYLNNSSIFKEPTRLYDQYAQDVDILKQRLLQAQRNLFKEKISQYQLLHQRLKSVNPDKSLKENKQQLKYLTTNLQRAMAIYLQNRRHQLASQIQKLDDNSPLKAISRGYVYTSNEAGTTITQVSQLRIGEVINLRFKDGIAQAQVTEIRRNKDGKKE
ncbi:exodeoxyribonuclease VII large subunit [Lactobacillus colini]|uniref:Exodeoxyribonuclease 7 large subunit n=1 Tax=Lactobacillus colini TaxID=1819254 RepID=A0ABS4MB71_9LACO|nr:exodeoxyribonuclease VII large subunit [Lactobacillus colini]MBP2056921.1 exodeoxyribonuclease VII large subunit [Lactobacillus colini]